MKIQKDCPGPRYDIIPQPSALSSISRKNISSYLGAFIPNIPIAIQQKKWSVFLYYTDNYLSIHSISHRHYHHHHHHPPPHHHHYHDRRNTSSSSSYSSYSSTSSTSSSSHSLTSSSSSCSEPCSTPIHQLWLHFFTVDVDHNSSSLHTMSSKLYYLFKLSSRHFVRRRKSTDLGAEPFVRPTHINHTTHNPQKYSSDLHSDSFPDQEAFHYLPLLTISCNPSDLDEFFHHPNKNVANQVFNPKLKQKRTQNSKLNYAEDDHTTRYSSSHIREASHDDKNNRDEKNTNNSTTVDHDHDRGHLHAHDHTNSRDLKDEGGDSKFIRHSSQLDFNSDFSFSPESILFGNDLPSVSPYSSSYSPPSSPTFPLSKSSPSSSHVAPCTPSLSSTSISSSSHRPSTFKSHFTSSSGKSPSNRNSHDGGNAVIYRAPQFHQDIATQDYMRRRNPCISENHIDYSQLLHSGPLFDRFIRPTLIDTIDPDFPLLTSSNGSSSSISSPASTTTTTTTNTATTTINTNTNTNSTQQKSNEKGINRTRRNENPDLITQLRNNNIHTDSDDNHNGREIPRITHSLREISKTKHKSRSPFAIYVNCVDVEPIQNSHHRTKNVLLAEQYRLAGKYYEDLAPSPSSFDKSNLVEARDHYLACVRRDPFNGKGWVSLAKIEGRLSGGYYKSCQVLDAALTFAPDNPFLYQLRGLMTHRMSISNLKRFRYEPKHQYTHHNYEYHIGNDLPRANLNPQEFGRLQIARLYFRTGASLNPKHVPLLMTWARVEAFNGFNRNSRRLFKRASVIQERVIRELDHQSQENPRSLSSQDWETQRKDAIDSYVKLMHATAMFEKSLGNLQKFVSLLTKAVEMDPQNEYILQGLGYAAFLQGDIETSRKLVKKAISVDPLNASAYEQLGRLEMKHGKLSKARKYFAKSMSLKPGASRPYQGLSRVELAEGNLYRALSLAKHAHSLNISNPTILEYLTYLKTQINNSSI